MSTIRADATMAILLGQIEHTIMLYGYGAPTNVAMEKINVDLDYAMRARNWKHTAKCDNCGLIVSENLIIPLCDVEGLHERLEVGSEVPAGECRKCGALVYRVDNR